MLFWQLAFGMSPRELHSSRPQTNPLKGQRPRPHMQRRDNQHSMGNRWVGTPLGKPSRLRHHWLINVVLLETVIEYPCFWVYVVQIHVDLNSQFFLNCCRNRINDLGINSRVFWPTVLVLHCLCKYTNSGRRKDNSIQWIGSTVSDSGEVLTHPYHIFRKTGTARTQRGRVWRRTWVVYTPSVWVLSPYCYMSQTSRQTCT